MEKDNVIENGRDEGAVEFHPELVKQRQDTYSSLTDLNGINVFFTDFEDGIRYVIAEKKQKIKELEGKMFNGQIMVWDSPDRDLAGKMFIGQEENILWHDYTQEKNKLSFFEIGMVLLAMMGVGALYIFFFRDRDERKKKL